MDKFERENKSTIYWLVELRLKRSCCKWKSEEWRATDLEVPSYSGMFTRYSGRSLVFRHSIFNKDSSMANWVRISLKTARCLVDSEQNNLLISKELSLVVVELYRIIKVLAVRR